MKRDVSRDSLRKVFFYPIEKGLTMENRFGNIRLRAFFLVILILAVFLEGRVICNAPAIPTDDGGDGSVSGDLAVGQEGRKEGRRENLKEKRESSVRRRRDTCFSAAEADRVSVGDTAGKGNFPICVLRC